MTRVLVADDHAFFRDCVAELLEVTEDLELVGESFDGSAVLDAVITARPDVVLMDVHMGAFSGLDALAAVRRSGSPARVIMLTLDIECATVQQAWAGGADGYLVKGGRTDLVAAVRDVARGGSAWPERRPARAAGQGK